MKTKIIKFLFVILICNIFLPIAGPIFGFGRGEEYLFYQLFEITRREHLGYSIILIFYFLLIIYLPSLWKKEHNFLFKKIEIKKIKLFFESKTLIKLFFFILISIPTIVLLNKYISLNRDFFEITRVPNSNLPFFWRSGIYFIVAYMLFVNFSCLYIYRMILISEKKERENIFFYFPIANSLLVVIVIILGIYSNKDCEDLPKERYCGCIYLEAYKGENDQAYKSLFNEKCFKYFD